MLLKVDDNLRRLKVIREFMENEAKKETMRGLVGRLARDVQASHQLAMHHNQLISDQQGHCMHW